MQNQTITHACGHVWDFALRGPANVVREKVAWLSQQDCKQCERRRRAERAAKEAEGIGLPELRDGSPAQIDWAETIRIEVIKAIEAEVNALRIKAAEAEAEGRESTYPDLLDTAINFYHNLWAERSARAWIDNRNRCYTQDLRRECLRVQADKLG